MNRIKFPVIKNLAISLLLTCIFISSCKEEEQDDPNIEYKSINKSVTSVVAGVAASDSIDLNGDLRNDFYIHAIANATADTAVLLMIGNAAGAYVDSTEVFGSTLKAKNLFTGQQPNALSAKREWFGYVYTALKRGTEKKGYAGVGDVFIPVLFAKTGSSDTYYGWLRINISSDYRTFKVIDAAYHLQPDTPIKMGAK